MSQQSDDPKLVDKGYRLGGPDATGEYDGMFICEECFREHPAIDETNINRIHLPHCAVTCLECNRKCKYRNAL